MSAPREKSKAALRQELDGLVKIDEERNSHQAELARLQSERDRKVGRMQVLAEQAGVDDLDQFVTDELKGRAG